MNKYVKSLAILIGITTHQVSHTEPIRAFPSPHVPKLVRQLAPVGQPAPSQRLTFSLTLPLQHTNELAQLLRDIYTPAHPQFRHYLTASEFADRFSPSQTDYDRLVAFCESHRLAVNATHPNRTTLSVQGAVKDIEAAFHTRIRNYHHPSENRLFYAPETEPAYDAPVNILSIRGLDNLDRPKSHSHFVPAIKPDLATPQAGSGPGGLYSGNDFRKAYAPGVTLTGTGQSLALVEFDGYYPADITSYLTKAGLSAVPLQTIKIDGFSGSPGLGNGEVALDIEVAIAMAPGLQKIFVYEADPSGAPNDLLNRIATDNTAKQISCSWSWSTYDPALTQVFQQFAVQGQSFLTASGDSDAFPGPIDQPADNPYVTTVGGTALTMSAGWSSETTWNDQAAGLGTGGGISTLFAIPDWQSGVSMAGNGGSTQFRNMPDIAMVAQNVLSISDNGAIYNTAGTSIAAPLWAAFVALANQQAVASGQSSIGFLNPTLYAMGNAAGVAAFHDITTGNNTSFASPSRFFATTGYDLCTGWGTPVGSSTITALLQGSGSQTTVPPVVDHFAWNIGPATWAINSPITITITAQTAANALISNFSGQLTLTAQIQDTGASVPIQPATVTCNNGTWTGTIQVNRSASGIVFTAADSQGHSGASAPINVAAQLSVLAKPNNGGAVGGGGAWVAGSSQTLLAVPASGWKFMQWQDGDTQNPRVLAMPETNSVFTATFAVIDHTPPTIALATKGGTCRAATPAFAVNGRAADKNGVLSVACRINGGEWTPAIGTTNWSALVTLAPGVNTIEAASTDTSSNVSAIAKIKVSYVPTALVSVAALGQGTISPNLNGQALDIGKTITLTAIPAAGQIFDAWSNGSTSKTARFVVASNLTVTATFQPNPFNNLTGTYNGLWFATNQISATNSGYITLTITPTGAFSGKLLNGSSTPLTGQFRADLTAQRAIATRKNTWNLSLSIGPGGIVGNIAGPDWIAAIQADRPPWNARTNPAPFVGNYKLNAGTNRFGTLLVAPTGTANLVATLPDQTHVSQTTTISSNGDWPLYQSFYNASGALIGWGQIADGTVTNEATWVGKGRSTATPITGTR